MALESTALEHQHKLKRKHSASSHPLNLFKSPGPMPKRSQTEQETDEGLVLHQRPKTTSFNLMGVPRELRLLIYEMLVEESPGHFLLDTRHKASRGRCLMLRSRCCYPPPLKMKKLHEHPLLHVSREIRSEYANIFYSKYHFRIHTQDVKVLSKLQSPNIASLRHVRMHCPFFIHHERMGNGRRKIAIELSCLVDMSNNHKDIAVKIAREEPSLYYDALAIEHEYGALLGGIDANFADLFDEYLEGLIPTSMRSTLGSLDGWDIIRICEKLAGMLNIMEAFLGWIRKARELEPSVKWTAIIGR